MNEGPRLERIESFPCSGSPAREHCDARLDASFMNGTKLTIPKNVTAIVFELESGWIVRTVMHDVRWAISHATCPRCLGDDAW